MAVIHHDARLVPSKIELVTGWVESQRWYGGKGSTPALRRVGGFRLEDPDGEVGMETLLLLDEAARPPVVYQVPLTYRGAPLEGAERALLGTMAHSVLGTRWVYDAPHDPVYARALVETVLGSRETDDAEASVGANEIARGHSTGRLDGVVADSFVLTGEQSNTSVICRMRARDGGAAPPVIVKLFRTVQSGENPDVAVQTALTEAGSTRVPTSAGHLWAAWDASHGHRLEHGHLAFAQEFIPGVEDAWRVALVAAAAGTDFTARARDLGAATAEIHRDLASWLGSGPAGVEARERLVAELEGRYAAAALTVPELASRRAESRAALRGILELEWPPLQRIHGDYHLGQVLDVPGRGWVVIDFEGEPLRPLADRNQPDLPERDIAGMLRSFDYAAGSVRLTDGVDATGWATACRDGFLAGYASIAGPLDGARLALVRALELDKALYEVVYEARNRPTWLPIPLMAVRRLLDDRLLEDKERS
ncbi:MAG: aminoglycoside phosphotransferase [Intrasporangium sp.]|uniref:maltokinase N-terminal cap-like domain-containing protein n=1 Tax=Intrasporangium sp. TaxID=1925024 RepID=UPI0026480DC0|nr:aminoglycoside phosphotransferase [Intrasporangium sp.]MDN5795819.1 aminoglycoside phosphotransferase [Intrasporangium sp.]